jgi:two-component system, cell cycle response regulator
LDDNETVKLDQVRVAPSSTKHPVLIVLQGDDLGASIPLEGRSVTIGRGTDCDLRLDDNLASRQHARLVAAASGQVYSVVDLGSTNGTFVNGQLVEDPYALQDGDKIRVGRHVFKFAWLDEYESEFQMRIQQMIIRDDLTNLLTQRSFFLELDRVVSRRNAEAEAGPPLCVLMMDLDHFKQVNDTYGHLVGSQTIKQVGELIDQSIRDSDTAGRYGGEEYIAYLPSAASEDGRRIADRIRRSVEEHEILVTRKGTEVRLRVTISIGVSTYPEDATDPVDLIEKADLALYRAKRLGRNQVCTFDAEQDRFDGEGYQRLDLRQMLNEGDQVR